MTDSEQTTEDVTAKTRERVVKKTSKKAVKKAAEPIAEKMTEQVIEPASVSASKSASKEDKRARLENKLKAMGMLPGSKSAAAPSSDAVTAGASLALPAWLSPQLLVLVGGAAVFVLLIWALDQEKQLKPQQVARSVPVYNPYAMAPPVLPHPDQAPVIQQQKNTESASEERPAYPAQAYYPGAYPYGYHPSMQFGFNGYIPSNGMPYYYGYPQRPPAYGYAPYGRGGRGYAYPAPPPQAGQR